MPCNQSGESEGMKESRAEIKTMLDELLREIRAVEEEVSRTWGDTAVTICGDTVEAAVIGVGRNYGNRHCSLCCPKVHKSGPRQTL